MTPGVPRSGLGWNTAMFINAEPPTSKPFGRLLAWDPVNAERSLARRARLAVERRHARPPPATWCSRARPTAASSPTTRSTGEKLWETPTGTGVIAAPSTYLVDGKQYVSIAVGWGGVVRRGAARHREDRARAPSTPSRWAARRRCREFAQYQLNALVAGVKYDPKHVPEGQGLYVANCVLCHGVPGVDRGGNIPNLGYSKTEVINNLDSVSCFGGAAKERGMPDFTGKLKPEDIAKLKAFIQGVPDSIRPK